jgi:hypothetical protein
MIFGYVRVSKGEQQNIIKPLSLLFPFLPFLGITPFLISVLEIKPNLISLFDFFGNKT